jgi:hypothetical protein
MPCFSLIHEDERCDVEPNRLLDILCMFPSIQSVGTVAVLEGLFTLPSRRKTQRHDQRE